MRFLGGIRADIVGGCSAYAIHDRGAWNKTMARTVTALIVLIAMSGPAFATDWGGTSIGVPPVTNLQDDFGDIVHGTNGVYVKYRPGCSNGTQPPCTGGSTPIFSSLGGTTVTTLPAGITGPGSTVGVNVSGYFPDSSSPIGFSSLTGTVPLSLFASSASVSSLQSQMQTSFAAINAAVANNSTAIAANSAAIAQLQAQMASQNSGFKHYAAQGIAQSLAMAGVGDIGSDERFSLSANWGTFGGENGVAIGAAVRISNHVSFNAGFASSVEGGQSGARAGIRVGW